MSEKKRKWDASPPQYNDDRFVEPTQEELPQPFPHHNLHADERDASDVEELLSRPDDKGEREYECTDTTPVNYGKGPHDEEFGVEETEFDGPDPNPVGYGIGPHDEEFGVEDEDDLEPLDDEDRSEL